ncbi:MAG: hypothetical protein ACM34G_14820, partial [Acidobacteriota bacterium]
PAPASFNMPAVEASVNNKAPRAVNYLDNSVRRKKNAGVRPEACAPLHGTFWASRSCSAGIYFFDIPTPAFRGRWPAHRT